jgi:hypothetical protein
MEVAALKAVNMLTTPATGDVNLQPKAQSGGNGAPGAEVSLFSQMAAGKASTFVPLLTGGNMQSVGQFLRNVKDMDESSLKLKKKIKKEIKELDGEGVIFSLASPSKYEPGNQENVVHIGPAAKPLEPGDRITGTAPEGPESAARALKKNQLEAMDNVLFSITTHFVANMTQQIIRATTSLMRAQ